MKDATRFLDVILSFSGLVILSPVFVLIAALIKISSKGPIIFIQQRVGKNNTDFRIYKFRTMHVNAAKAGALTIANDKRITSVGVYLRKLKLDELPQLFNVLKGDMSMVGPRPELRRFVNVYDEAQKNCFNGAAGYYRLCIHKVSQRKRFA